MHSVFAAVGNQSSSDFFIQLDEPNRVYFPGDEIRGVILIRSSKRIRSSSIRLRFKGKVTTNARESRMFRVFDNSVPVDELEKVGYTPHQRFAFMANLPQGTLPSIYSFNGGSISYTFKATLHSSWLPEKLSKRCAVSVNVLDRIDIQAYPAPVIRPFQTEVKVKKKKTKGIAFVDVLVGKGAVLQGKSWCG
ncbi:5206_t:CDS:2 [Paraglomus occultum]|uniref:5206_t:CDS:1 n=1 Tax=Paraglomus occultum TaxID=144539 RepID=A0A9N9AXJ3_9GLOM|nr:5206_t:CDS:2 [Paraglomus occultum]